MSYSINGINGGNYGGTRVQKTVVDGNTYYTRARGGTGPNGVQGGTQWVVVDMGSNGSVDGGAIQRGAIDENGRGVLGTVAFTPDGVKLSGSLVNGEAKSTWSKFLG